MIENFLWQYVDIPANEIEELQDSCREVMPDNDFFFQFLQVKMTHLSGHKIKNVVLIQNPPGQRQLSAHVDSNKVTLLAVNIPLEDCEKSTTRLWKSETRPRPVHTQNGHGYLLTPLELCTQIAEFKVTRPVLWDTSVLHSVDNSENDKWRRAISIRFEEEPWHWVNNEK